MHDTDLLKSDASSDEKTYYVNERVRRRYKRWNQDSQVPELEQIVTQVAKLRPTSQAPTHRLPLFRTQSSSIFDTISRENFELRRQNEELSLEVKRLKEHLCHAKEHRIEQTASGADASTRSLVANPKSMPSSQPEWIPEFFEALTTFIKDNSVSAPNKTDSPDKLAQINTSNASGTPIAEIAAAIKDLQASLKELVVAGPLREGIATQSAGAPNWTPSSMATGSGAIPKGIFATKPTLDYTPPSTHTVPASRLDPEIIDALRDLKVAVSRPISVSLEPSKALAGMMEHPHHHNNEPPALSSPSSTIEQEEFASDEVRRFLEQLRVTDPKQYEQVLENIHQKVADGDSTNFEEFVEGRLGGLGPA